MIGLSCLVLAGCKLTSKPAETVNTWTLLSWEQVLTWMQSGEALVDQNGNVREEVTGDNVSLPATGETKTTPVVTGTTTTTTTGNSLSSDVANLIEDRASKPKDPEKLTEDDIDFMQKIIDMISNIGN